MKGEIKKADLFKILDECETKEDVNRELVKREVKYQWVDRTHIGVLTEETSYEVYTFDKEDSSLQNLIKNEGLCLSEDTVDFLNEVDKRLNKGMSRFELGIALYHKQMGASVDEVVNCLLYTI